MDLHQLLVKLGCIHSREESDINPYQDFVFLGYQCHRSGFGPFPILQVPQSQSSISRTYPIRKGSSALAFLGYLGFPNSLSDVIPLGRLRTRPLQLHLLCRWSSASMDWDFGDSFHGRLPSMRGAYLTGQIASGSWTSEDFLLDINVLEMKAVILLFFRR